jgi:hypothetical protein
MAPVTRSRARAERARRAEEQARDFLQQQSSNRRQRIERLALERQRQRAAERAQRAEEQARDFLQQQASRELSDRRQRLEQQALERHQQIQRDRAILHKRLKRLFKLGF